MDHSGQSTFSLHTDGVALPLTSYGPTVFLHVHRPTEDELQNLEITDITDPHGWDPYDDGIHISLLHTFPQLLNPISFQDPIDDLLIIYGPRQISRLRTTKPKHKLTPEYLAGL